MEGVAERRADVRAAPAATGWAPNAMLRPGQTITIVNLTARGVLFRTRARVLPNKRVELQLMGQRGRHITAARVLRCRIVDLRPLCYEAAVAIDEGLAAEEVSSRGPGSLA